MTREEAIEIVKSITVYNDEEMEALKTLIPGFGESEDERMIKFLIEIISKYAGVSDSEKYRCVNWLEKRKAKEKYDRMAPIYDNQDSFESALDKAWKFYDESGSRIVDECEDNATELAFAKGFREGVLYHQQSGEGFYFQKDDKTTSDKDSLDSAFTKMMLKDQHPITPRDTVDWSEDEIIRKEIIDFIKWSDVRDYIKHCPGEWHQPGYWIANLEKQKEQKPVEWSDEDDDRRKSSIKHLEEYANMALSSLVPFIKKDIDWLKSLSPKLKWRRYTWCFSMRFERSALVKYDGPYGYEIVTPGCRPSINQDGSYIFIDDLIQ